MTPGRFSVVERDQNLDRIEGGEFDVVVVGGGITGAGVALDAATRGLDVALVERGDFASGTSSRSSKLVHGGLRYLNQGEFRLVYEALAERQRLLRLAPHLVRSLPFLIPVFGKGAGARAYARAAGLALWMYDLTGGARIGRLHQRLSRDEMLERMPDLDPDRLAAGFLYYDARVDDARLTLAVIRTAAHHGAVVANYTEVTGLPTDPATGRVSGVDLRDVRSGRVLAARARAVVNATGVWAGELGGLSRAPGQGPISIRPAKGVHLTLPAGRPRLEVAAVLPVPGDKRSVFVIPWGERVYVGTTDTDYDGGLDEPVCTAADVDYLLGALNASITRPVDRSEVLGTWAGLRPLVASADDEEPGRGRRGGGARASADDEEPGRGRRGGGARASADDEEPGRGRRGGGARASADDEEPGRGRRGGGARASSRTADLSRRHKVRQTADGLITVVGGKLTTYRRMAAEVVDAVAGSLPPDPERRRTGRRRIPRSRTGTLPLFGAGGYEELAGPDGPRTLGLPRETVDHLAGRYGGGAREVARMVAEDPTLGEPLVPGLPYLRAEAVHAARCEMAVTLTDVLARRTRALLLDEAATAGAAAEVGRLLAGELGWSAEETARQVAEFCALVERQREAARAPGDPAEAALDRQVFTGPPGGAS